MSKIIKKDEFEKLVLNGKGKILVDFFATWCGPCRMLAPIMEELSKDYQVYKIDVDEEPDLAQKYGVMSIPCVVQFVDGEEKERLIGLQDKNEYLNLLK